MPVYIKTPAADLAIQSLIEKLQRGIEKGGESKKRELLALLDKWDNEQTA
jgi:hypothetical protein